MKTFAAIAALGLVAAAPALAADPAAGEREFSKCRACHMIADGDDVIQRGGKIGPNLHGVVGRQAGTVEGFSYGDSIVEAGEAGLVWNEENLAEYMADPQAFLADVTDDRGARSKMTFKLRRGAEDVAAYLATFSGGS